MNNRKDNRKRNLRPGEYQKADGRYEYRYKDEDGKIKSIYSLYLVPTDGRPALREMETEILKGERKVTDRRTFDEAFEDYILTAPCREHVKSQKKYWYKLHIKVKFGSRDINGITNGDLQKFYRYLGIEKSYSASYIEEIHSIINGVYRNEMSNRRVLYNPAENLGKTLKYYAGGKPSERRALTSDEQEAFIFALDRSDVAEIMKCLLRFLLGTGCRVSEALSLMWKNVDFEQGLIHVDHCFVTSRNEAGGYERYLSETKTSAGKRAIPMMRQVRDVLLEAKRLGSGKNGFIFVNSSGNPYTRNCVHMALDKIRENYNCGVYGYFGNVTVLPPLSAHILRHTFCTRLCENVNEISGLKSVADIMGHANVNVTLNVYTNVSEKQKMDVIKAAEELFTILPEIYQK